MALHQYYESETITKEYFHFGIKYNNQVRDVILENLKKTSGKEQPYGLMVDVGCGSGQATNLLAPYFKKVLASDVSKNMIKYALAQNKFDHVTYEVGRAEEVKVEDHSADLLLSAASAQYYDVPLFLKEAERILKPNGCLVIMGYSTPILTPIVSGKQRTDLTGYATNLYEYYFLFGEKYDVTCCNEICQKYPKLYAAIRSKHKHSHDVKVVYPEYSLTQAKGSMRAIYTFQSYYQFKANEIRAEKGFVTEEDMKPFDVSERFGREIKEKIGLEDVSDDDVKFRAVYEVAIHVANGLSADW